MTTEVKVKPIISIVPNRTLLAAKITIAIPPDMHKDLSPKEQEGWAFLGGHYGREMNVTAQYVYNDPVTLCILYRRINTVATDDPFTIIPGVVVAAGNARRSKHAKEYDKPNFDKAKIVAFHRACFNYVQSVLPPKHRRSSYTSTKIQEPSGVIVKI